MSKRRSDVASCFYCAYSRRALTVQRNYFPRSAGYWKSRTSVQTSKFDNVCWTRLMPQNTDYANSPSCSIGTAVCVVWLWYWAKRYKVQSSETGCLSTGLTWPQGSWVEPRELLPWIVPQQNRIRPEHVAVMATVYYGKFKKPVMLP